MMPSTVWFEPRWSVCFSAMVAALMATQLPASARACGGVFCDGTGTVVQSGERILFEINDDDTVTTTVEIQYQGQPENFSWVLPVPATVDVTNITTVEPGLFDDLEVATAPVFRWITVDGRPGFLSSRSDYGSNTPFSFSCARPVSSDDDEAALPEETQTNTADPGGLGATVDEAVEEVSEVQLIGEAVVGPYDIQLIAPDEGADLVGWLSDNGYQQPPGADAAIAPYQSAGMAFLGLQLDPDVGSGAIEAISFTYPGSTPMIPLVLTSVAATPSMEVIVYVTGEHRYEPEAPYLHLPFDWDEVEPEDWGSNYTNLLREAVEEQQGHAFVTEYAGSTGAVDVEAGGLAAEVLDRGAYISRFRTFISPWEMTVDPTWVISDSDEDVSNVHTLGAEGVALVGAGLGPLVLLLFATVRRPRRRTL